MLGHYFQINLTQFKLTLMIDQPTPYDSMLGTYQETKTFQFCIEILSGFTKNIHYEKYSNNIKK